MNKLKFAALFAIGFVAGDHFAIKRANRYYNDDVDPLQINESENTLEAFYNGMSVALRDKDMVEAAYNLLFNNANEQN